MRRLWQWLHRAVWRAACDCGETYRRARVRSPNPQCLRVPTTGAGSKSARPDKQETIASEGNAMPKVLLHDIEARRALARGVQKLAAAVESTLGPKGMNAMVDRPIGTPIVSRDGVTIA